MNRTLRALVGTAALALTATACNANPTTGPTAAPTGTHRGGTLTIYTSSTEQSFDPAKSQSLAITSQGLVHRRLTTWDIRPGKSPLGHTRRPHNGANASRSPPPAAPAEKIPRCTGL